MIEVNLLGSITATEVFLAQLNKNGAEVRGGDIVNIVGCRLYRPIRTRLRRHQVGPQRLDRVTAPGSPPDVRVTLIEPGVVATELPHHITHY